MVTYAKEMKTLEKVANDELIKVARWFQKNKLTLNVDKTNYVIFSHETRHSVNTIIRICIDGEQILRKSTIRHLGVIFQQHLRWGDHINNVLKKTLKYLPVLAYLRKYLNLVNYSYETTLLSNLTFSVGKSRLESLPFGQIADHTKKDCSDYHFCPNACRCKSAYSTNIPQIANTHYLRNC